MCIVLAPARQPLRAGQPEWLSPYDVVWNSPSADYHGTMPIGNGDIGLNVWVEPDDDLRFYIAKTDAWNEECQLLKLGRIRVKLTPNPFVAGAPFAQRLDLVRGAITITAGPAGQELVLTIWVDANRPVIRLELEAEQDYTVELLLETWRGAKDVVPDTGPEQLVWYYRNSSSMWARRMDAEGAASIKSQFSDPLLNRTFGALIAGDGFTRGAGRNLVAGPAARHTVSIHPLTRQTSTASDWVQAVQAQAAAAAALDLADLRAAHRAWWTDFWNRSWVRCLNADSTAQMVTQRYSLQRFVNACGGRGAQPIKFNGSIFTYDPYNRDGGYEGPDYRQWGGAYWFQNTRLAYWPMPAAGDYDLMQPLFDTYRAMLPLRKALTGIRYGHDGMCFPETVLFWGNYQDGDYNNSYILKDFNGTLELLAIMLDYHAHTADADFAAGTLLPFADEVLTFWARHFPRGADGKLRMEHSQALETYWDAHNPSCDIAGLRWVLDALLALPGELVNGARRESWTALRDELPGLPFAQESDNTRILPAITYDEPHNSENPELYTVFPFRLYGVGKPDLATGQYTYRQRRVKGGNNGWRQDPIQAACLGMTDEAESLMTGRFAGKNPAARFPAFFGPNFDWTPDQCHGNVAAAALQTMLLQADGGSIFLFPAWPADRDVEFKLHAPANTTVDCTYRGGRIEQLTVVPAARTADIVFPNPSIPCADPYAWPAQPADFAASPVSDTAIQLTWTDASGNEKGFRIRRSTDGIVFPDPSIEVGANQTRYTDTGLSPNRTYYYKIKATGANGDSAYTTPVPATTAWAVPDPPSGLTAQALSTNRIALSWSDNSESETGFRLERRQSGLSDWHLTDLPAGTTSCTDTGLLTGTEYIYKMVAYNAAGESAYTPDTRVWTQFGPPTEYYVATSGSDGNNGTSLAAPFRTIQKAASVMKPGDVCRIRQGTYRETVRPANSGVAGAPITFEAYNGEDVIVSGADPVTGWTVHEGSIYRAALGYAPSEVFVNRNRMNKARFPNTDPADLLTQTFARATTTSTGVTFTAPALPAGIAWAGAQVWVMSGDYWVAQHGIVTAGSGNTLTLGTKSRWWFTTKSGSYDRAYVSGLLALLDTAGEWHYGGGALYLWASAGVNPASLAVEAGRRRYAFDLSGRSHVTLKGVGIFAATVTLNDAEHCTLDRCWAEYVSPEFFISVGFNRQFAEGSSRSVGVNAASEGLGITVGGRYNTVRGCTVKKSFGDGISVFGQNHTVEDCVVRDCNWSGTDCALLCATGRNHLLRGNTLYRAGRTGLLHRGIKASRIEYNDIHDTQCLTDDGGGTYAYGTDGEDTVICYNWVHDDHGWSPTRQVGAGIYLDNGCANFSIHHNVMWNCTHGMRLNAPWTNYQICNNTIRNGMVNGFKDESKLNVKTYNNLSDTGPFLGTDLKNNLQVADPKFVNAGSGDFRLQAGSPAIDYGLTIAGVTDGYAGTAPDAGAYEYGGPAWTAGVPAPLDLTATPVAPAGIELAWIDNFPDEGGFVIERRRSGTDGWDRLAVAGPLPANSTRHTDTGLLPGTKYYYKVKAVTHGAESAWSRVAGATTLGGGPPAAPVNLSATALAQTQVALSWTDNSGNEDGFRLERRQSGLSAWHLTDLAAGTTSHTD
ncbi:MAG: fibronectin type III domain-containing protein, partial [Kiritimatiellae bacterium]|nr:fibronectin type III domain-containing protein [Kiritimatiellia bacterium]